MSSWMDDLRSAWPCLLILFVVSSLTEANAQNVRDSVRVDTNSTGSVSDPAMASAGNLSAVVYSDGAAGGSNTVSIVLSDGRGLDWSDPVRIDQDLTSGQAKFTRRDSVQIIGNSIYVSWSDERFGISADDLYFRASHDGGATWESEIRIDKPYPVGSHPVMRWCMAVAPGTTHDYVYFLFTVDATGYEDIFFAASHNSGANFSQAIPISSAGTGTFDVDEIALGANGPTIHACWQDNRNSYYDDVFYQRSDDGGITWMSADRQLDISGPGTGDAENELSMAVALNVVAVCWQEELDDPQNEEVRVNVSSDSGQSWNGDLKVGDYDPQSTDTNNAVVTIGSTPFGPLIVAAWDDERSGDDEIYTTFSSDYGFSWRYDTGLSLLGGQNPHFYHKAGAETVALTWRSGDYPNRAETAYSRDGGGTWDDVLSVSPDGGKDVDHAEVGFNSAYTNVICFWLAGDYPNNNVYVGGFRPQTLTPVGPFVAGGNIHVEVSHWPAEDPLFGVLISAQTGSFVLPFGDGRETGLFDGPLLGASLNFIPGMLSGKILPDGTGTTPVIPFPSSSLLPPGTTLHCVAVGFDPYSGVKLGALTDIMEAKVQ